MYFVGDTHSIRPIFELIDKYKLESQNLIHVGDLGLGFQEVSRDLKNLALLEEALNETGNNLYVIRGNHDNPIFWDKNLHLPTYHNINLIPDHSTVRIENKVIYFAGGATSIDRRPRMAEHPPSWWKGEKFIYDEKYINRVLSKISNIDMVVTHSAPHFAYPQNDYVEIVNHYCDIESKHGQDLRTELRAERADHTSLFQKIKDFGFTPSHWLYGHFHSSKKEIISGTEFKLLNVNELYKV